LLLFRCDGKIYPTWHAVLPSLEICWTGTCWISQLLSSMGDLWPRCRVSDESCRWCFMEALFMLLEGLVSLTDGKGTFQAPRTCHSWRGKSPKHFLHY